MSEEDAEFYRIYWLQELIAWGLHNGMSKRELMEDYYPDEILTIRKMVEMHKARDYLVLLSIADNSNTKDPNALRDRLRSMCGAGVSNKAYYHKTKLNTSQFERLKQEMAKAHSAKRG